VTIRDAHTKEFVPKVQVKVIGSDNPSFLSGETDLRGVYVAEAVRGQVTAVARKATNQYAFYRGTTHVGQPAAAPAAAEGRPVHEPKAGENAQPQSLDQNLKSQNMFYQNRQIDRLQQRYGAENEGAQKGVKVEGVK
jgi:hypothetical protein